MTFGEGAFARGLRLKHGHKDELKFRITGTLKNKARWTQRQKAQRDDNGSRQRANGHSQAKEKSLAPPTLFLQRFPPNWNSSWERKEAQTIQEVNKLDIPGNLKLRRYTSTPAQGWPWAAVDQETDQSNCREEIPWPAELPKNEAEGSRDVAFMDWNLHRVGLVSCF